MKFLLYRVEARGEAKKPPLLMILSCYTFNTKFHSNLQIQL